MNPILSMAFDGVKMAVSLARSLIDALSKTEQEREAHNAALEKELEPLRAEVKAAAAASRAKLVELDAKVPDPDATAPVR